LLAARLASPLEEKEPSSNDFRLFANNNDEECLIYFLLERRMAPFSRSCSFFEREMNVRTLLLQSSLSFPHEKTSFSHSEDEERPFRVRLTTTVPEKAKVAIARRTLRVAAVENNHASQTEVAFFEAIDSRGKNQIFSHKRSTYTSFCVSLIKFWLYPECNF